MGAQYIPLPKPRRYDAPGWPRPIVVMHILPESFWKGQSMDEKSESQFGQIRFLLVIVILLQLFQLLHTFGFAEGAKVVVGFLLFGALAVGIFYGFLKMLDFRLRSRVDNDESVLEAHLQEVLQAHQAREKSQFPGSDDNVERNP